MSTSPVHLAVDLGASSGRVIAGLMQDGKLVLEEVHRFSNGPVTVQDALHWNVHGLWAEILEGLRLAAKRYDDVLSVGVDTWGVDYVLLDRNDQIAAPVRNYRDPRNGPMVQRAMEIMGGGSGPDEIKRGRDAIFAATGLQFMQINTLYQLLAAVEAKDVGIETAETYLMMGDFFHWLLTGKHSVETTMASTSQMQDPKTGEWATDLMESLGIPSKIFSPVIQPGTTLGVVQPSVAELTGLKDVPVIAPATHDTASAVISVPVEEFAPENPSWCYISSGTWSLMGCELASPKVNELCAELNFTNEGGAAGSTRLLKNLGGLWVFQQIREADKRRGCEKSWAEMVDEAKQAAPFELLIDPDAADFIAPTDMIDAIDQYAERTGQNTEQTRRADSSSGTRSHATYYRAALEGLALRYRVCLGMLEQLVGNRIDTIYIVGGGSMNEMLCQMTADACGRSVVAGPVEATAIGNVVMQMVGTSAFGEGVEPAVAVSAGRKLVRESFAVKTYQPSGDDSWEQAAARFVEIAS